MKEAEAFRMVLVTVGSGDEASRIARALVEEGLAACVNIVPEVRSIYRWKGALKNESEALLLIKTSAGLMENLEKKIRILHSYEIPEILVLPIDRGNEAYLAWLEENLGGKDGWGAH